MDERDVAYLITKRCGARLEDTDDPQARARTLYANRVAFSYCTAGVNRRTHRREQWTTMTWRVGNQVHVVICRERLRSDAQETRPPAWEFVPRMFLFLA